MSCACLCGFYGRLLGGVVLLVKRHREYPRQNNNNNNKIKNKKNKNFVWCCLITSSPLAGMGYHSHKQLLLYPSKHKQWLESVSRPALQSMETMTREGRIKKVNGRLGRPRLGLDSFQGLKNVRLQDFKICNTKAEPNQIVLNPNLGPLTWTRITVQKYENSHSQHLYSVHVS